MWPIRHWGGEALPNPYLFITLSGSCTLRPPRLIPCCVPLHRRQISWYTYYVRVDRSNVSTRYQPRVHIYVWVTGRRCILWCILFYFPIAFPGCPRFFPSRVTILARARSCFVSFYFFSFSSKLWLSSLPLVCILRFFFILFVSPSFSFFVCIVCFVLFRFVILSLNVFRVADDVYT